MPLVSVLLPFFNATETLESAIQSIQSQTYKDWELLLVDDGSTDGSEELAKSFATKDDRIHYLSLPHAGIVSALLEGLKVARGDFVARMDADDLSLPERFQKQVAFLESHSDVDLVACQVGFGGDVEKQAGYAGHVAWVNRQLTHEDHYNNRFVDAPVAHPSVMWRRGAIEEFGSYREGNFPEDFELWLRWFQGGARFAKIPEELLIWQDLPTRLSRTDARYAPETFYDVKCLYLHKALPRKRHTWLWGAGRVTRNRFKTFEKTSRPFKGFIDVDEAKIGKRINGRPVVGPEDIPDNVFIILGVASHGVREQAIEFLEKKGLQIGKDFIPAA
jgi:glycosyltransferase involved in cell wall biosynthesis